MSRRRGGRHRAGRPARRRAWPLVASVGLTSFGIGGAIAVATPPAPVSGVGAAAPMPSTTPDAATARVLAARAWVPAELRTRAASAEVRPAGLPANRLSIPSLEVEAPIDSAHAVGGALALPTDASRVAHYDASPALDAREGTTIVAGHVTNTPQVGALFPLATVRPGALVYTTDAADRLRAWSVVSVSAPLKADLPPDLFTASGPRRLAIITCGGAVTTHADGTRSYPRNVVVIATPAPPDG